MTYDLPDRIRCLGTDILHEQLRYHRKRVTVTKEFTFDAAHHLYEYVGKCTSLHGHTYRLSVSVSALLDDTGLAIDFADVKRVTRECIVEPLDHRYLNAVLPAMNTTAENMIVWMYEQLAPALIAVNPTARLERLVLWETPTSSVEITREEMES